MKACGIVAEYNPFHNGHAYQIERIREELNPDVVIAVMSGNFLQRGEPALVDKWTRTQMALAGGVDLVIELPVMFSTQVADYFGKGAIQILGDLGIDHLSFGVEAGTAEEFMSAARWMVENEDLISSEMTQNTAPDVPYAKQMEMVLSNLAPNFPLHLNSPNNQLGFAYAKEIVRQGLDQDIALFPIKRKDAEYHETSFNADKKIASATAIRKAVFEGTDVSIYIPEKAIPYLLAEEDNKVSWENYFPLLKYQLTVQSEDSLREIYEMTEGLENRLKKYIAESNSFSELMELVKTKRYTWTRLQRLFTYVLLGLTKADVKKALVEKPAIRILGFNEAGRAYLSEQKHSLDVPLISNVNQKTKKDIPFDVLAGEIYALGHSFIKKQDFTRKPVKFD